MEMRDERDLMDMYATIYCERETHKAIIIGKDGRMLKQIGSLARENIEGLLDTRVNLQLWIKVAEDWRNRLSVLRELGYE
jgi:GTP-binding protein Era